MQDESNRDINFATLELLNEITEVVSKASSPHELSTALFPLVDSLVTVHYAAIYLWDFDEERLRMFASKGFSAEDIANSEKTAIERHPGTVYRDKIRLHIPDMSGDQIPNYVNSGIRSFDVKSRLWEPIYKGDTSLGAYGFASTETNFFTSLHIQVLEIVCKLIGDSYSNMVLKAREEKYINELKVSLKRIEAANLAQQNFIAKMSHEIRTPLNGILGFLELLKMNVNKEENKAFINVIEQQSGILIGLVNDVLDISKIDSDEFTISITTFNLRSCLDGLSQSFHRVNDDVKMIFEYDSQLPEFVLGDILRISQVVQNLLSNAFKFTSSGFVRLSVRLIERQESELRVRIEVIDTGIGIPPNKINTIFERFTQADDSIQRSYGGAGLGLYLVKALVTKMEGNVTVESVVDQGSKFVIDLPFVEASEQHVPLPDNTMSAIIIEDSLIMVVEDNPVNADYLCITLEKMGGKVILCKDGKQAIDVLQENQNISIILMDLQMPEMDGITATKIIRNDLKLDTPLYVQSANIVQTDLDAAIEAGADGFLTKPYQRKELIEVFSSAGLIQLNSAECKKNETQNKLELKEAYQNFLNATHQDEERAKMLIKILKDDFNAQKVIMADSLQQRNGDALKRLTHRYKSTFAVLGFENIAGHFREMDALDLTDAKAWMMAETIWSNILDLYERLIAYL
jgi:signal transduction histidine kinase/CheY-like chemotaxis protein